MIAAALVRRTLRGLAALAAAALCAVAVLLLAMWAVNRFPTELPLPTGHYAVGRTMFDWVDGKSQGEPASMQRSRRELIAWVWYPAPAGLHEKPAEYLPPRWRDALARRGGILMSDFLTRDLGRVQTHSIENAPVSADERQYPVIIFLPGSGALVAFYTTLAEDLASHGYIVVGLNAVNLTSVVVLPDGHAVYRPGADDLDSLPEPRAVALATRLVGEWTTDIDLAITRLTALNTSAAGGRFAGRMDLRHLGIVGHSLGGASATNFCYQDARCKAGIDLDGRLFGPVVANGLRQPFMFALHAVNGREDPVTRHILEQIHSMYARLPASTRLGISIAGANHFSFSDQMLVKNPIPLWAMRRAGFFGLAGARALQITAGYIGAFFDVYLKGSPRTELSALARKYPEARVWSVSRSLQE